MFQDFVENVIAALSQKIGFTPSIELAKALATRRAMVLAKELSLFNVVIEGDFLQIVQALESSDSCKTLFGQVVEESKWLGCTLRHCQFQHVRRKGNKLAHGLARRAVLFADTDVWVEDLSGDLEDVFQSDFV